MQIKKSINIMVLGALMAASVPTATITGPIVDNFSFSRIGTLLKNHPGKSALAAFVLPTLYFYYDTKPTKDASRFNMDELRAKLEGKSTSEQLHILAAYFWYFYKDEVVGHGESKSKGKADGNGNVVYSKEVPGKGYIYSVHKHKDAIIKTLSAPLVMAFMYALLEKDIKVLQKYLDEGIDAAVAEGLKIPVKFDAKPIVGSKA